MTRIILFFLFPLLFLPSLSTAQGPAGQAGFVQYFQERNRQVSELWQKGDFHQAVEILEELLAHKELRDSESPWQATLYNLACGYSLLNQKEQALGHLRNAVEAGYAGLDQVQRDTDLDNIRDTRGSISLLTSTTKPPSVPRSARGSLGTEFSS